MFTFDADEDLAAIIPMPLTIPAPIRTAISRVIGDRFEFAEDLEKWLHRPHQGMCGATPFERLVDGDGLALLVALCDSQDLGEGRGLDVTTRPKVRPHLRLVR